MNSKVYRWCAVPLCYNTSIKTPDKLFVFVPQKKTIRDQWLKLARRDSTAILPSTHLYFCEDHFDMPNDMKNYMEYHLMGSVSQIRMKLGCMPTKYQCQSDRKKRTSDATERSYILKKQRKTLIEECKKDLEEKTLATKQAELGETLSGSSGVKKEPFDYTDSLHEAIDAKKETRLKIKYNHMKKESPDIDSDGTSVIKEESIRVNDVKFVNIMDHLFKIEREGVEMRHSDVTETSLMNNINTKEVDISSDIKLLKSPIVLLQAIFIGACAHCKQQFHSKHKIQKHLLKHGSRNIAKLTKGNTKSANKSYLNSHLKIQTKKKRRKYKCSTQMVTHTGEKPFTCHICKITLTTLSSLRKHIKSHTEEKLFVCEVCDKKFIYKFQLNDHVRAHTGEKPFMCEFCKKQFSQKTNLNKHMITHTGEKPFTCEICERKFNRKFHFKAHMITHNKEKPYSCDYCLKKFSQKTYLYKHMLIHTRSKPYTCDICKKKFNRKGHLDGHMKTHTVKTCDICNESFIDKTTLIRHLKTHSANKPFI